MREHPSSSPKRVDPWRAVWLHPESTLEFVLRYQPEEFMHRLYMALGFVLMLALRLPDWMTARPDPIGVMIQMLLVGPILGLVLGYLQSSMISLAAGWMRLEANKKVIRATLAWTNLPFMLACCVFMLAYVALSFGLDPMVKRDIWLLKTWQGGLALGLTALVYVYASWIRVRGLAYIFSVGKPRAAMVWAASVALTYLPLALFITLYTFIFYATITRPGGV